MKKLVYLLSAASLVFISLVSVSAHSGDTDGNGGHYSQDSSEYHYHHGYSAHQHINGKCPYESKTRRSFEELYEEAMSNDINWYTKPVINNDTKEKNSSVLPYVLIGTSSLGVGTFLGMTIRRNRK